MSFSIRPGRAATHLIARRERRSPAPWWRHLVRRASICWLLCGVGCDGQRGAHSHPSQRDWVVVTTDHFRVYSDLNGENVKALAASLEQDLALIGQAIFQSPAVVVEPTDVVVFSRRAHFQRYFPKSVGGVAYPRLPLLPESHHTVVTFEQLDAYMRTTLCHELVHDVYARNFGAAPPWLAEGVAQYFSTVELIDGQIHIGVPLVDRAMTKRPYPFAIVDKGVVIQAIPRRMIPPASALLTMSADDFYGHANAPSDKDEDGTTPQTMAHYFGAWSLVHYLMGANGEYSQRFRSFLTIVTTKSVSAAWTEAFTGADLHRLDQEFRAFLDAGRFALSGVPYRPPARGASPTIRSLAEGEEHLLLAKLALARSAFAPDEGVFSEELDAALHSGAPPAEAYYLRGMYAQSLKKDAEAERDFKAALRLAPDDPHIVRASLAHEIRHRHGELTEVELGRLRAEAEKLERLASSPVDLLLVAHFHAMTGEVARSLSISARAVARSPVDPLVLTMYAEILAACDRLEEAILVQRRAVDFLNDDRAASQRFRQALERLEAQQAKSKSAPPSQPPPSEAHNPP